MFHFFYSHLSIIKTWYLLNKFLTIKIMSKSEVCNILCKNSCRKYRTRSKAVSKLISRRMDYKHILCPRPHQQQTDDHGILQSLSNIAPFCIQGTFNGQKIRPLPRTLLPLLCVKLDTKQVATSLAAFEENTCTLNSSH